METCGHDNATWFQERDGEVFVSCQDCFRTACAHVMKEGVANIDDMPLTVTFCARCNTVWMGDTILPKLYGAEINGQSYITFPVTLPTFSA